MPINISKLTDVAAGSAVAIKHIKNQAEANELADKSAALNAVEHIEDTVKGYDEADMQANLTGKEIEVAQGEYEKEVQNGNILKAAMKNADIKKLQEAQQSYQMKADAKRLQAEIYRDQINKVGKKGESLGTIKFSWEKEKK